jgi:hypothetical protein
VNIALTSYTRTPNGIQDSKLNVSRVQQLWDWCKLMSATKLQRKPCFLFKEYFRLRPCLL